jgi:hypothetical protein
MRKVEDLTGRGTDLILGSDKVNAENGQQV